MYSEGALRFREKVLKAGTWQKAVLSCAKTDERVVFVCDKRETFYSEYESVTNHLAAVLRRREIGPGKTAALRMKRTQKLFLALYGIVKSGAALLPIPSDMPVKRVEEIYAQIQVDITIDDAAYEEMLCESAEGGEKPLYAKEGDAALILFTSGSTGMPKGVVHTQKNILYTLLQYPIDMEAAGIPVNEFDTVLSKTNINFLSSYLFEIPLPVFLGKQLVIFTEEEQNSVREIAKRLGESKKPGIFLTPSQVESYLKEENFAGQFQNLRVLLLGGEGLSEEVRAQIIKKGAPDLSILNIYGATECEIILCRDERDRDRSGLILMPDTNVLLVGEDGEIAPEGEPGELLVSSPHQFLGYIGIKARMTEQNGTSYFCTGDMGVRFADGSFAVRGRKDRMIKFHGMRVELSDIEENICRFPGISECAVVVNRTERGTQILCAYYVCEDGREISAQALRSFLTDYLPVNLIPVGFIPMNHLPLNENGKRNNRILSERIFVPKEKKTETGESGETHHASNAENIALLCRIVSGVTHEEVSPEDNLFALLIESLMDFRIISELGEEGFSIGLEEVFSNPVIGDLACILKKTEVQGEKASSDTEGSKTYAATGIQIYWGTDVDFNKKTRGLYTTEDFISSMIYTEETFRRRILLLFQKHPALRSSVSFEEEMPIQTICSMEEVCMDSAENSMPGTDRPLENSGKESGKVFCLVDYKDIRGMRDKTAEPFEFSDAQKAIIEDFKMTLMGILAQSERVFAFQASYFRVSDEAGVIIFTGNHGSIDGTSMNILMQELASPELDDKEDCYRQFLTYIGKKENIGRAIAFYSGYLQNAEFSGLPKAEKEEGREDTEPAFHFKGVTIPLGEAGTKTLYKESRELGVSPVGYLMFTYGQALMKALHRDALIMQILTFGRGIPVNGMDQAVGCFIEYVPIVIRKEDTIDSFQKGYLMAEQNSFAPLFVIWDQVFGLKEPPELAPFLISEVFPDIATEGYFRKLTELDYEKMFMGNFIAKKDGKISIYFHYDTEKYVEKSFLAVTDAMQEILKEKRMMDDTKIAESDIRLAEKRKI